MKKTYEKPAMRVVLLQQQQHLLSGSNEVQSLRGDYFDYGGSDENYDGDARLSNVKCESMETIRVTTDCLFCRTFAPRILNVQQKWIYSSN